MLSGTGAALALISPAAIRSAVADLIFMLIPFPGFAALVMSRLVG